MLKGNVQIMMVGRGRVRMKIREKQIENVVVVKRVYQEWECRL